MLLIVCFICSIIIICKLFCVSHYQRVCRRTRLYPLGITV